MSERKYKATALAAAVAAAIGSAPQALAQDDTIEEVVVTGSYIRRTEFEGRAPIQIVDAATIELTGAAQVVDVLKELTVNSGSQFYNETNDRAGVAQFNIRNLGLGSTLTLLNGKRAGVSAVADQSGTDFVDINQYPVAMIERIEVLTDGASATYGSQAVAGVANIITRKGFEGFELSGGYSASEVDSVNLNLAAGSQFDRGGFNVYASYYDQDHIERSEFDWMQDRLVGQGVLSRSRFLSSTGSPGSYRRATIDPATGEAADLVVPNPNYDPNDPDSAEFLSAGNNPDPNCEAAGGVILDPADTGESAGAENICRYHFVDQVSVISAEERFQVFTEFDWEFNDSVKYYAEASFSNNVISRDSGGSTLNTGRANGGGFTIPSDHPFNFFEADPADPVGLVYIGPENWDPNVNVAADLRAIARPLGADVNNNNLTQQIHREFQYSRILNGFEITLPNDWYMDFSYMWAKSTLTSDSPHNYRSNEWQDLVAAGLWNPFGTRLSDPNLVSPKDGTSVAGTDPVIQDRFDQRAVSTDRAEEKVVDLVVSGELFELGGGMVAGALGAQYRRTELDLVPDSLSAAGEANETGLTAAVKGNQNVLAFFGEVIVPVSDFAEIQIAVRNEDYGDGVSTTDPKFSFEWSAADWMAFRGSWGTSFQAPTVRQTASASSSAFLDDPASPGAGPNGAVCVNADLNNNVAVTVQGAPGLSPQESENFAFGVIFQLDQFSASVDYWNFDYQDLIAQSEAPQAIVNNDCLDDGIPNDPRVVRDAGGQLREVITEFVNIGSVVTDGIDVNANYSTDIGTGSLSLNLGATFVNKFDVDADGDGTTEFDGAGSRNFNNSFSTMPELRANLSGTYFLNDHTFNLALRHIDGYKNDQSNNGEVDAWTTIDAQYSYLWTGLIGEGDTTLTLGVNNIADEDPPALTRFDSNGNRVERFRDDGTYNRGWVDRPGYDDRAGHDIRGRIVYFGFKQTF